MSDCPPTVRGPAARPAAPSATICEVCAGGVVVRYRRSGAGRPVVVLGPDDHAASAWPVLLPALADRFRLIVPDIPGGTGDVAGWLVPFLEGLGTADVAVVADAGLAAPCVTVALDGTDQVARVVLVPDGARDDADDAPDGGALAARVRDAGLPVLRLPPGLPPAAALRLVLCFLAGDDAPVEVAIAFGTHDVH